MPQPLNPRSVHRPPEISHLNPEEEEEVCSTPKIRVAFSLTPAMRAAMTVNDRLDIDPHWFDLKLDEVNLTKGIETLMTMNYPPTHAELLYEAERPLGAGQHTLSVTFPQGAGVQRTYTWKFQVDPALVCKPHPQSRPELLGEGGRTRQKGSSFPRCPR
jgi:hypothetical protein